MSTTETLQQKLNEKADAELRNKTVAAVNVVRAHAQAVALSGIGWGRDLKLRQVMITAPGETAPRSTSAASIGIGELCDQLIAAITEAYRADYRQQKTAEFISKVDSLQEQIDEVRGLTGV